MSDLTLLALIVLSVVIGGAYTALGLRARAHLTPEASESDRSIGWLFWWSCAAGLYDAEGRRLCRIGNALVVPLIALYAAWYFFALK
jgi:hypothetical protein